MNLSLNPTLSGIPLESFLDETEEAINLQADAGVAEDLCQATLRAALRRRPCVADSMATVSRLHRLWLRAGDAPQALRVLETDGAVVAANLPRDEQADAGISLSFWRINTLRSGAGDDKALQQALVAAERRLASLPAEQASDEAWSHLGSLAADAGDQACARRCAQARHALQLADEDRAPYRAWDQAVLGLRLCLSHAAEGRTEDALSSAQAAIRALADAAPGQDVDTHDWLHLGEALVPVAPQLIEGVLGHVRALIPADLPLPRKRGELVRIARLEARALQRQGQLDQALAKSVQGRFWLTSDEDDAFSASVLDWLIEAGRTRDAATLAFECAFNERPVSSHHACRLALHRLAAGGADDGAAHWALVLAFASTCEAMQWVCGDEQPAAFFARHLALAAKSAPAEPAVALLRGLEMVRERQDHAGALPLLEAALRHPPLTNSDTVQTLWVCRMRVHGPRQGLSMPFIDAAAAGWCYSLGVQLDDLHEQWPEGTDWPEDLVDELKARYYDRGLFRFESFFATGIGMLRDADAHVYSMLCNNLAIHQRWSKERPDLAIELHRKGIDASPFAEHYDGLMRCHEAAGQQAEFADAADRLWHFAAAHGYGRHDPSRYVAGVSTALYSLDRDNEIAIWLQRIEEWWSELDDEERSGWEESYLETVVIVLANLAHSQPQDALVRLDTVLPKIRAARMLITLRNAGLVLERANMLPRALALYQDTLALCTGEDEDTRTQREKTREAIARCTKTLRAGRPWWRFWG